MLLLLCYAQSVKCQSLTLNQLIMLRKNPSIEVDEYLIRRGWKFGKAFTSSDSVETSFWVFDDIRKRRVAELSYSVPHKGFRFITYSTPTRSYYAAIKTAAALYHMEFLSQQNDGPILWNFFRGTTYDVSFGVYSNQKAAYITWYTVQVQPHGMIKIFSVEDGKVVGKGEWVYPNELMSEEQGRRIQAEADSIAALKK